jgi:Zn-dependent membrane protease YugP
MMFFILIIGMMLVGGLVSGTLKSRMNEYGQIPLESGLSGEEVAQKMLRDNGIYDVTVTSVEGTLTDHYDPTKKTVNLSPDVYNGRSVASAAIAAHECGHAVQHATAYSMLGLRSALVPIVGVASTWVQWVLIAGILTVRVFPGLLIAGVVMFGVITLFSVITLPVEFDASRRGLAWLDRSNIMGPENHEKAKNALWWAAMTYVVAAISSIATLLYYISILNRRN